MPSSTSADLHGRGVRSEQELAIAARGPALGRAHEEGVLHVARGVIRREVQRLEVEPVELDLGPVPRAEAEALEHGLELADDARDRVERAARHRAAARQRQIELVPPQLGLALGGCDRGDARVDVRLPRGADLVEQAAARALLVGRELAEAAEERGELAALPEGARLDELELGELLARLRELRVELGLEGLEPERGVGRLEIRRGRVQPGDVGAGHGRGISRRAEIQVNDGGRADAERIAAARPRRAGLSGRTAR
jgi:hypothetical protein